METETLSYYVGWSGFPSGGYCAYGEDHQTLRLGAPYGEMPKRHKTPDAAHQAARRYYTKQGYTFA